jgi:hypothetical protein
MPIVFTAVSDPIGAGFLERSFPRECPDAEQAVKEAMARYGIDNPQGQARLAAQRVREIG